MFDKHKKLSKEELIEKERELEQQEEQARNTMLAPFEIHVMPQRFQNLTVTLPSEKKGNTGKVALIVFGALLVVGGLAFGAYKLYVSLSAPLVPVAPSPTTTAPVTPSVTAPTVETVPVVEPTPTVTEPTPAPVTPTPAPVVPPVTTNNSQLTTSIDTDSDGLTDIEEEIYKTTIRIPDTDNDGFVDGQEILNLYSPLAAGSVLLSSLASINTFLNTSVGYSVLHPSAWLVRSTDDTKKETLFTSVTGEITTITAFDNPNSLTLTQFLIENQPQVNPNLLASFKSRSNLTGLVNNSKSLYFLDSPTTRQVFKISYEPGTVTRVNFLTTVEMMVHSLKVQ